MQLTDGPGEHEGVALDDGACITVEAVSGSADRWIEWSGCPVDGEGTTVRVADAGLALAAAANGLGRACVPRLLAAQMLDAGSVRQIGESADGSRGYWLIAPAPQWRQKKVKALVAALSGGTIP